MYLSLFSTFKVLQNSYETRIQDGLIESHDSVKILCTKKNSIYCSDQCYANFMFSSVSEYRGLVQQYLYQEEEACIFFVQSVNYCNQYELDFMIQMS
uniref:Uncharacterized protein n=1 Tax=Arundo donax TaxID=35708 RepID=A0A0A8YAC4_ARUDO